MTNKQYRSPLMASIHDTAKGLHAAGVRDERTKSEFDELCLTSRGRRRSVRLETKVDRAVDHRRGEANAC